MNEDMPAYFDDKELQQRMQALGKNPLTVDKPAKSATKGKSKGIRIRNMRVKRSGRKFNRKRPEFL